MLFIEKGSAEQSRWGENILGIPLSDINKAKCMSGILEPRVGFDLKQTVIAYLTERRMPGCILPRG